MQSQTATSTNSVNVILVWPHSVSTIIVIFIAHPQEGSVVLYWNKLFLCSLSRSSHLSPHFWRYQMLLSCPLFLLLLLLWWSLFLLWPLLLWVRLPLHCTRAKAESGCTISTSSWFWAKGVLARCLKLHTFFIHTYTYSGFEKATMKIWDSKSNLNLEVGFRILKNRKQWNSVM